jgi:DivIVA domain-containing protein
VSFFLVFLAVVLVAAVLWAGLGRRSRKNGAPALPAILDGGFEEPPANLPPVLLQEHAAPGDVEQVRFSLCLRGYRMDQVDQVLDELRDQLAARDAELDEMRIRLAALEQVGEQASEAAPPAPGGGTAMDEPGSGNGASGAADGIAAQGKGGL